MADGGSVTFKGESGAIFWHLMQQLQVLSSADGMMKMPRSFVPGKQAKLALDFAADTADVCSSVLFLVCGFKSEPDCGVTAESVIEKLHAYLGRTYGHRHECIYKLHLSAIHDILENAAGETKEPHRLTVPEPEQTNVIRAQFGRGAYNVDKIERLM